MVICCNSKDAADKVACSEVVGPSRLDAEFKLEVDVGDNCERPLVTHLPPSTVPLENHSSTMFQTAPPSRNYIFVYMCVGTFHIFL